MMNSINIMGRLTQDPEPNYTPSGVTVLNFCLAVDRDSDREKTDFVDVLALGKTADLIANTLRRGELIGITGSLQTNTYTNRDGYKRKSTNVLVSRIYYTGKNKQSKPERVSDEIIERANGSEPKEVSDDDCPFLF